MIILTAQMLIQILSCCLYDPFGTLGGVKQLLALSQNSSALSKFKSLLTAGKGWYQRGWSPSIYITGDELVIVCVCKEELMKVSSVAEDRLL